MAHQRKFRFGVQVSRGRSPEHWAKVSREAESLGYSSFLMPDHFTDQFAPVPALMAAADATTTLRVGTLVFANDYKHPVVLAKEVATLDVLSNGRFEMGLGAGWTTADYEQAGLILDRPGVRIDRLAESIQVIKGLMGVNPCTFEGRYYQVRNLDGKPKPLQHPHPPLIIGGGARRILTLAAQQADIVGINADMRAGVIDATVHRSTTAAATAEKLAWVRAAAGDRYADIELQMTVYLAIIATHRDTVAAAAAKEWNVPEAEIHDVPHVLLGSVDQIVDTLQVRRERYDVSYIVVAGEYMREFEPIIKRLAGT